MLSTPSERAISFRGRRAPLYCITDVREVMRRLESRASIVVSSSVMPSAKYSWLASPERLSKGRTAREAMVGEELRPYLTTRTVATSVATAARPASQRKRKDLVRGAAVSRVAVSTATEDSVAASAATFCVCGTVGQDPRDGSVSTVATNRYPRPVT